MDRESKSFSDHNLGRIMKEAEWVKPAQAFSDTLEKRLQEMTGELHGLRTGRRKKMFMIKSLLAAAAVVAISVGIGFDFLTMQGEPEKAALQESVAPEPVSTPKSAPIILKIMLTKSSGPGMGDWDFSRLSQLLPMSDVVVCGKVSRVRKSEVEFEVKKILKGKLGGDVTSVAKGAEKAIACMGALDWVEGEECCLFLQRDPSTKQFKVVYEASGKQKMPFAGILDAEALESVIKTGAVPPKKLAEIVKKHGPYSITKLFYQTGYNLHGTEAILLRKAELATLLAAPEVQDAMLDSLREAAERDALDETSLSVLEYLSPDSVKRLKGEVQAKVNAKLGGKIVVAGMLLDEKTAKSRFKLHDIAQMRSWLKKQLMDPDSKVKSYFVEFVDIYRHPDFKKDIAGDLRDALIKRIKSEKSNYNFKFWLEIYLFHNNDLKPVANAVKQQMNVRIIRLVEHATGKRYLDWVNPTGEELSKATAKLAEDLKSRPQDETEGE